MRTLLFRLELEGQSIGPFQREKGVSFSLLGLLCALVAAGQELSLCLSQSPETHKHKPTGPRSQGVQGHPWGSTTETRAPDVKTREPDAKTGAPDVYSSSLGGPCPLEHGRGQCEDGACPPGLWEGLRSP